MKANVVMKCRRKRREVTVAQAHAEALSYGVRKASGEGRETR
jgi:hypothetical protein